jgi:hypothetical protein
MLIDSRLKPELCAKKPPTPPPDGGPVEHSQKEHILIFRELPGVTPKEVGEGERAGVAFATDGVMAVVVPVTLQQRYLDDNEPPIPDVPGPMIPAALGHARKNLVAPKTASIELGDETVTPDFAAFQRRLPGLDPVDITLDPSALLANLGPTHATSSISFCPFRLLAIAKAMGVKAGDGVTVLLRGDKDPMSVLPLLPEACFQGEALGILHPICPRPDPEEDEPGSVRVEVKYNGQSLFGTPEDENEKNKKEEEGTDEA